MIVHELQSQEHLSFVCHIQGTDIDAEAIEKANKGEYQDEELFEAKRKYLNAYFTKLPHQSEIYLGHERYQLNDEIKSMVRFSSDNILNMLLHNRVYLGSYNLILCRNVLIYLNSEMQEELIRAIGDILYDQGYLGLASVCSPVRRPDGDDAQLVRVGDAHGSGYLLTAAAVGSGAAIISHVSAKPRRPRLPRPAGLSRRRRAAPATTR